MKTLSLVTALALWLPVPLLAQRDTASVVEPRLTRIFGSDSMLMGHGSLSPDGRWIVVSREEEPAAYNLWLVPTAGGDPIRLTNGRFTDEAAVWFPSGDRIAFRSSRFSPDGRDFVATLAIDPRTGQPVGAPRQISLDAAFGWVAVSPDGASIAYHAREILTLKVVPASGGTARSVVAYGDSVSGIHGIRWSPDGGALLFFLRIRGRDRHAVLRIRITGGTPEILGHVPIGWPDRTFISPDGRHLLLTFGRGPGQRPGVRLATINGRTVTDLTLRRGMNVAGFTPDGTGLVARQSNVAAPIRVAPVAGGAIRQLTDGREYEWPLAWSGDASRVFVQSASNGHTTLLSIPVAGGAATEFTIPAGSREPFVVAGDGRHVQFGIERNGARAFRVHNLATGQSRDVATNGLTGNGASATGPGGSYLLGEEFPHFRRQGNRLELWAVAPEGQPRLVRGFPASLNGRAWIGVHRNRVAFTERRGDSTALFTADGPAGTQRLLATVPGSASSPVWSNAGEWIAYDYYLQGNNSRYQVLLVGVAPDGSLNAPPRILDAGGAMWGRQIQWLPDDRGFTVFAEMGTGSDNQIYLVSLREGERAVALTRDDPAVKWGYELSPDGRYVAYPAEIPRGSSLWLVDLRPLLGRTAGAP